MKKLILFVVVAIFGCANPGMDYVSKNKHLAEQGQLAWSAYYEQAYAKYNGSNFAGKGATLGRINNLIIVAKEFEAGKITKDQFDYARRRFEAEQHSDDEIMHKERITAILKSFEKQNTGNLDSSYQIVPPIQLGNPQPTQTPAFKQTDFTCLDTCTKNGYSYGLCQSKCSY